LQGDLAISAQGAVSLPAVQRYVDRFLKGDVAPAIEKKQKKGTDLFLNPLLR
jgi:hypothetical protein